MFVHYMKVLLYGRISRLTIQHPMVPVCQVQKSRAKIAHPKRKLPTQVGRIVLSVHPNARHPK
jgi:hypothetical protein